MPDRGVDTSTKGQISVKITLVAEKGREAMAGPDPFYGLNADFASRLRAMMAAAPLPLTISSGYRSPIRQAELYDAAVGKYGSPEAARKWVAPPGRSQHNFGMAADLGYGGGGLGHGSPELIDWA